MKTFQTEKGVHEVPYSTHIQPKASSVATEEKKGMPTFSPLIRWGLPGLLTQITRHALSDEDADLLLLGALTVFSACLPNVSGVYGERKIGRASCRERVYVLV